MNKPDILACWLSHVPRQLLRPTFLLVRCFITSNQHARCVHFITSNKLHLISKQFFYCLLYSQVEQKDWNNAETSLFDYEEGTIGCYSEELISEPENMPEIMLNSRIQHLIARVNEACDRKDAAATHYCDAVAMDRHAISSLRAMSEKRLLTSDETEEFLERLAESNSNSQEKSKENMEMMNVFKQEFDQNGSQENIFNFFEFFKKLYFHYSLPYQFENI